MSWPIILLIGVVWDVMDDSFLSLNMLIVEYISLCFPEEERLMRIDEYPWYESHKEEHRKFLEDIIDFQVSLIAGKQVSALKIGAVLYNWLTDHIGGLDKRYPIFLFVRSAA